MTDARPLFTSALDQMDLLVPGARDALDMPTPCTEWSVRQLLAHVVAAVDRATAVAQGADPRTMPVFVEGIEDGGWEEAVAGAGARAQAAWADDDLLERLVTVPWGQVPGKYAVAGYTQEVAMHSWDLATATGQVSVLQPQLPIPVVAIARQILPADQRGGPVPFGPVVDVAEDADPWTQLAGWLGRRP
jgi:uncharacterized protein (TIGR03086 family)